MNIFELIHPETGTPTCARTLGIRQAELENRRSEYFKLPLKETRALDAAAALAGLKFCAQFDTDRLHEVAAAQRDNRLLEYCRTHPQLIEAVHQDELDDYFSDPTPPKSNLPVWRQPSAAAKTAPRPAATPASAPPPPKPPRPAFTQAEYQASQQSKKPDLTADDLARPDGQKPNLQNPYTRMQIFQDQGKKIVSDHQGNLMAVPVDDSRRAFFYNDGAWLTDEGIFQSMQMTVTSRHNAAMIHGPEWIL
jgi:hypothetical protein